MKKKKIIAIVLGVLLVAGAVGGIACATGNSDEILLKENQRYVYAYITSIQGNEITYMELEESVVTVMLEPETEGGEQEDTAADKAKNEEDNPLQSGGMPNMNNFPGGGGMPDMSNFPGGGEMSDMSNFPGGGEMPDMGSFPGGGEMPDMSNFPSRGETGKENGSDGMQFSGMAEAVTTYIPVGVTVHTAADVATTFSRLADGDLVKMLVESKDAETEVIEEIWMLQ